LAAALLVCHLAFEGLVSRAMNTAVLDLQPHLSVKLGNVRTWPFPCSVELRNCFVQNPSGYASAHLAHVRTIKADIGLRRLLLTLGREVEVGSAVIDGVSFVVEKRSGSAGVKEGSNASELLEGLAMSSKNGVSLGRVDVRNIDAIVTGGGPHVSIEDVAYDGRGAGAGHIASLLDTVGRALLAVL